MTLKDWADVATIIAAIAGVCAVVAALVGVKSAITQTRLQMKDIHLENKKWNTLNICAQYELSEIIAKAARNLYFHLDYGKQPKVAEEDIGGLSRDAIIILNYLDGIAIGVSQGLYVEELARDHLHIIVRTYVDDLFNAETQKKFGLKKSDYTFLIGMDGRWRLNKPYYRDQAT